MIQGEASLESGFLDRRAPLWFAMLATAIGVGLAYLMKHPCLVHGWADNFQYKHLCYNDIQPLFGVRGISRGLVPYRDVQVEYPVLTGIFMDLTGRVLRLLVAAGLAAANSDVNYFKVSAVLLAPFAFIVTGMLRRLVPARRLLLWCIGTPLVLYAFHNWDLLAVAASAWGLAAIEKKSNAKVGSALSVGASAKLYPAFLLPAAVLERWGSGDRPGARRLIATFIGGFALINLPWVLIANGVSPIFDRPNFRAFVGDVELRAPNSNGWLGIWRFHATRYPDFGTVWYWIAHHARVLFPSTGWDPGQTAYRDFVSIASLLLFAGGSLWFLWHGYKRRREPDGYPTAAVGLGIIAMFLLTSKVNSPQYTLWMIPLIVMLNVPWRYVFAYLAGDLAVYVSGFYYFTVMSAQAPAWQGIFELAVLFRAATLVMLAVAAAKAQRARPAEDQVPTVPATG